MWWLLRSQNKNGLILKYDFTQRRKDATIIFMTEDEISKIVLDVAFDIHRNLGPGLLESVYEAIMEYELVYTYGLKVSRQRGIPVIWQGMRLELGFRSDLIVEVLSVYRYLHGMQGALICKKLPKVKLMQMN